MVVLEKATDGVHKYQVTLDGKTVKFGALGYKDFTKTGDEARKELYLNRHRSREDWSYAGRYSPGFWSRWILWNKRSVSASLADVRHRFDL